jgi:hypothetical protein
MALIIDSINDALILSPGYFSTYRIDLMQQFGHTISI